MPETVFAPRVRTVLGSPGITPRLALGPSHIIEGPGPQI